MVLQILFETFILLESFGNSSSWFSNNYIIYVFIYLQIEDKKNNIQCQFQIPLKLLTLRVL